MKIGPYETHPIADAFPLLEGQQFDDFRDSIKRDGLRQKEILLFHGKLLDGRNRLRACLELGIEPTIIEYDGDDPLGVSMALNFWRRQMNETARCMAASKLASFVQGRPAKSRTRAGLTQAAAAAALGVSERGVQYARAVNENGVPELVQAAERGDVPIRTAGELAALPAEEQRARLQELASPAPRSRAKNENESTDRGGPPPAQALMRVIRRAIEGLGGTIKTLRATDGHGAELLVAYAGKVFSVSLATEADAELVA